MNSTPETALVPFHGHQLLTTKDGDTIRVAMKPIGEQETTTLPLDHLNGWLFAIDTSRVKSGTVADVRPHHVAARLDEHDSKVMANTGKSILSNVLITVRRGLIERNPAREVDNLTVKRRTRYLTDEEYLTIRAQAHPVLAAAMDLSYATDSRIGDILEIRLSHISPDGLLIRQEKTNKLQMFSRNPALDKALENARAIPRSVRGLFLLCTERGRKYQYAVLNRLWIEARTATGVENARFHNIRGKSATDAKHGGQDYLALLGRFSGTSRKPCRTATSSSKRHRSWSRLRGRFNLSTRKQPQTLAVSRQVIILLYRLVHRNL